MERSDKGIDCLWDSRSPHITQKLPCMGRIAEMHSSQTGNREILVRKESQRRHSEGKIVANRLSAMPRSQEAGSLSIATLLVEPGRVRPPLLLKTNLPRPGGSQRLPPDAPDTSIAVGHIARNARSGPEDFASL